MAAHTQPREGLDPLIQAHESLRWRWQRLGAGPEQPHVVSSLCKGGRAPGQGSVSRSAQTPVPSRGAPGQAPSGVRSPSTHGDQEGLTTKAERRLCCAQQLGSPKQAEPPLPLGGRRPPAGPGVAVSCLRRESCSLKSFAPGAQGTQTPSRQGPCRGTVTAGARTSWPTSHRGTAEVLAGEAPHGGGGLPFSTRWWPQSALGPDQ